MNSGGALRVLLALKAVCIAGLAAFSVGGGVALGDGLAPLSQPSSPVSAVSARLSPTPQGGVLLDVDVTGAVDTHVFSLKGPDRLVVDFPEIRWGFDPKKLVATAPAAVRARGVKGVRVGLFRLGRSRLVVDLEGPVRRGAIRFVKRTDGAGGRMLLELTPVEPAPRAAERKTDGGLAQRAAALAVETASIPRREPPRREPPRREAAQNSADARRGFAAPAFAPTPRPRPAAFVIALDPGHGGRDPGARHGGLSEKTFVLRMAKALGQELRRDRRVRVVLTREDDRFLELGERVEIARRAGAHLFVSMHADALPGHPDVNGASFYTLSDRASDALSARLARNENGADGREPEIDNHQVKRVLLDFARRRAKGDSHHLVERMVASFKKSGMPLLKTRPHREANFRVLRNFDQPSLLIELGFLTSIRDRRRFTNPAWRETAVKAMASAILSWREDREAPAYAGDLLMQVSELR